MKTKNPSEQELKDSMKQNWTRSNMAVYDQFHFAIEKIPGASKFKLYWHGEFITETHTLSAAKTISTILLNDKILK